MAHGLTGSSSTPPGQGSAWKPRAPRLPSTSFQANAARAARVLPLLLSPLLRRPRRHRHHRRTRRRRRKGRLAAAPRRARTRSGTLSRRTQAGSTRAAAASRGCAAPTGEAWPRWLRASESPMSFRPSAAAATPPARPPRGRCTPRQTATPALARRTSRRRAGVRVVLLHQSTTALRSAPRRRAARRSSSRRLRRCSATDAGMWSFPPAWPTMSATTRTSCQGCPPLMVVAAVTVCSSRQCPSTSDLQSSRRSETPNWRLPSLSSGPTWLRSKSASPPSAASSPALPRRRPP